MNSKGQQRKKQIRCRTCMFRAKQWMDYQCNYAGLTGHTRRAEPPESCTHYREGARLIKPVEERTILIRPPKTARKSSVPSVKNPPIDWAEAKRWYDAGLNDREIGEKVHCRPGAVCAWRHRRGYPANAEPVWQKKG